MLQASITHFTLFATLLVATAVSGTPLPNSSNTTRPVLRPRAEPCPDITHLTIDASDTSRFGRTTKKERTGCWGCFAALFGGGRQTKKPSSIYGGSASQFKVPRELDMKLYGDNRVSDVCQYQVLSGWSRFGDVGATALTPRPGFEFTEGEWLERTTLGTPGKWSDTGRAEVDGRYWTIVAGVPLVYHEQWQEWTQSDIDCEDVKKEIVEVVVESIDPNNPPTRIRFFDEPNVYFRTLAGVFSASIMGPTESVTTSIRMSSYRGNLEEAVGDDLEDQGVCAKGGFRESNAEGLSDRDEDVQLSGAESSSTPSSRMHPSSSGSNRPWHDSGGYFSFPHGHEEGW